MKLIGGSYEIDGGRDYEIDQVGGFMKLIGWGALTFTRGGGCEIDLGGGAMRLMGGAMKSIWGVYEIDIECL